MKQFPQHRIIFKGELENPNANAYSNSLAAQIEPSRYKNEGILFISAEEAHFMTDSVVQKIGKNESRISDLESVIEAIIDRYESVGSESHLGVSHGIYKICKDILKKK